MRVTTVLKVLLAAAVLAFGGSRILAGLGDQETQVRRQLSALLEAVDEGEARRLGRFVTRSYLDEDTGVGFDELRGALGGWGRRFGGGGRDGGEYVASLLEEGGLQFLPPAEIDGEEEVCTVRLACLVSRRGRDGLLTPYWNLEATLDLVTRRGTWKVLRSREVNHGERGRA